MIRVIAEQRTGAVLADHIFEEGYKGTHVILSVEEYNTLIRQINLIKLAIGPIIPNDGVKDKLFMHNSQVIDDRT